MNREPTEEEHDNITQAIVAGDRTQATSLYISIKRCGLTEAQEYIKKLTADLNESEPERFAGRQHKKRIVWDRLIFSPKK